MYLRAQRHRYRWLIFMAIGDGRSWCRLRRLQFEQDHEVRRFRSHRAFGFHSRYLRHRQRPHPQLSRCDHDGREDDAYGPELTGLGFLTSVIESKVVERVMWAAQGFRGGTKTSLFAKAFFIFRRWIALARPCLTRPAREPYPIGQRQTSRTEDRKGGQLRTSP